MSTRTTPARTRTNWWGASRTLALRAASAKSRAKAKRRKAGKAARASRKANR